MRTMKDNQAIKYVKLILLGLWIFYFLWAFFHFDLMWIKQYDVILVILIYSLFQVMMFMPAIDYINQ